MNAISFHPTYGTFSTAGADGTISTWDKDSKQRITTLPKANGTIACTAFNRNGTILAYAISYDWTKVGNLNDYHYNLLTYIPLRMLGP